MTQQSDIIQTIFKDSNYHLALFSEDEIDNLRTRIFLKMTRGKETPHNAPHMRGFFSSK